MISKAVKVLIGVLLVALGGWTIYLWWPELLTLVKGSLGLVLILAGLIAFALVAD
jgi:hypothetical protein